MLAGFAPSGSSEKASVPCLSELLVLAGNPGSPGPVDGPHTHLCLPLHTAFSLSLFLIPLLSLIRTLVIGFRAFPKSRMMSF